MCGNRYGGASKLSVTSSLILRGGWAIAHCYIARTKFNSKSKSSESRQFCYNVTVCSSECSSHLVQVPKFSSPTYVRAWTHVGHDETNYVP